MRTARHTIAVACAAAALAAATPAVAQQQFMDPEFNAQWGLAAIGAQYALAKGITGDRYRRRRRGRPFQATHPEFAGRIYPVTSSIPTAIRRTPTARTLPGIIGAAPQRLRHGGRCAGRAAVVHRQPFAHRMADVQLAKGYRGALAAGLRIFNNSWGLRTQSRLPTITRGRRSQESALHVARARFGTPSNAGSVLVFSDGQRYATTTPTFLRRSAVSISRARSGWITVTSVDAESQRDLALPTPAASPQTWCMAAPGDGHLLDRAAEHL